MMKKLRYTLLIATICNASYAGVLQSGKKFKIIKPIYLVAWYDDLGNKKLSREAAQAYLHVSKNADRPYIGFQHEVQAGTTMTIVGLAPKPWYLYFNSDYYVVTLDPDVSQGLEVKLPLNSSFQGGLDGLNPEIFDRL